MQTGETNQKKPEREIFELDKVKYFVDSLPEDGKKTLTSLVAIEQQMFVYQTQIHIAEVAKGTLVGHLTSFKDKLEKVEDK